jgi:hypothetical protein
LAAINFSVGNRSTIRNPCLIKSALVDRHAAVSGIVSDNGPVERRAVGRTKVLRNAKIIVPARSPVIHCTVQNITSSGARLKLANTYGLPETFELTFEHGRTRRACRVIWRTTDTLGVAFEGDAQAEPAKAPPPRE